MERGKFGQVPGRMPGRAELRSTCAYSEAQFARFVRTSIVRAVRNGARTFEELLAALPSIYPTVVLAAMDGMTGEPGVDGMVLGRIHEDARLVRTGQPSGGSLLPLPHPLDFEWRFSNDTCREMLMAAWEITGTGETVLLYGTPGLAYAAISIPVRDRRVVFVGEDTAVTQRLVELNKAAGKPITMDLAGGAAAADSAAVVVDPPWYPDYLKPMLRSAAQACRPDGVVLASLPPLGVRPSIAVERDRLERFVHRQGLDLVALEESAIGYETPFFEENALAAAGVYAPRAWRRGDLGVYRRRRAPLHEAVTPSKRRKRWLEAEIGGMRLRVRLAASVAAGSANLRTLVPGDVLPSVSRRDPRRALANVWTSGNRIYQADDPMVVLEAAYACGASCERSLWRNLAEEEAFGSLVDQLAGIAAVEGAERVRSACGTAHCIGRAA